MEKDPTETMNLAGDHQGKTEELETLFTAWKEGLPQF